MYTLTQEQVNELAKGKSIQELLPESFKLEVGKWYKSKLGLTFCFQGVYSRNNDSGSYGFASDGDWDENIGVGLDSIDEYTEATREEVEAMLIAEAKKRGFVEGANVKGLSKYSGVLSLGNCMGNDSGYYYNLDFNWLMANISLGQNAFIFEKGQWATIVPESKSDILTELIDYAKTNDNLWLKNQLEKLR